MTTPGQPIASEQAQALHKEIAAAWEFTGAPYLSLSAETHALRIWGVYRTAAGVDVGDPIDFERFVITQDGTTVALGSHDSEAGKTYRAFLPPSEEDLAGTHDPEASVSRVKVMLERPKLAIHTSPLDELPSHIISVVNVAMLGVDTRVADTERDIA